MSQIKITNFFLPAEKVAGNVNLNENVSTNSNKRTIASEFYESCVENQKDLCTSEACSKA